MTGFENQHITLYGDSVTDEVGVPMNTYRSKIMDKFNTTNVYKRGYSGYQIGKSSDSYLSLADSAIIDEFLYYDNSDMVIIMAGLNDYWGNCPLGERYGDITDEDYKKTSTGGLRYILDYLFKRGAQGIKLMFCTPNPSAVMGMTDMNINTQGLQMWQYVERFIEICSEYHVPVADIFANACWDPQNEINHYYYSTDGIHLSNEGYEKITSIQFNKAINSFQLI